MRTCQCPVPSDWRVHPGLCELCGKQIDKRWTSNDVTIQAYLDRLSPLPDVEPDFLEHIRERELAGRDEFGHEFLGRANAVEAQEEAVDLALYCGLALLRARREGREEQSDVALMAAHHAAAAYQLLKRLD